MGLLDMTPDQSADLLNLGVGLLSASGPSRTPVSFGQAFAAGVQNMQQGELQRIKNQLTRDQLEMNKAQRELQAAQVKMQMEQMRRTQSIQENLMKLIPGALGGQQEVQLPQLGREQGTGQYRLNVETPQQREELSRQLGWLAANDPQTHKQVLAALEKQGAIQPPVQNMPPNYNQLATLGAMGELAGVKGAGGLMELAKFHRPDYQMVDSGGQISFINKNAPNLPVIGKTMSPDAIASNQLGWFNAMKPTYHDGALVAPDGSITKTPMYAPPKNSPEATAMSSAKALPLIDEALKLLPQATGSLVGAGFDTLAAGFGRATSGAKASARLKAIEGSLMMAQPRMEGPQSDSDRELYRQMAGKIGDEKVPVETRAAALETIRGLHEKYSSMAPSTLGNGVQGAVRRYNPATGRIE